MSIGCKFATAEQAKQEQWFSRRHRTSEAHMLARDKLMKKYLEKTVSAAERHEFNLSQTASERIEHLDKTLGKNQGAARERKRLASRLEKEKKTMCENSSRPDKRK